jgi:hypothetical protein
LDAPAGGIAKYRYNKRFKRKHEYKQSIPDKGDECDSSYNKYIQFVNNGFKDVYG